MTIGILPMFAVSQRTPTILGRNTGRGAVLKPARALPGAHRAGLLRATRRRDSTAAIPYRRRGSSQPLGDTPRGANGGDAGGGAPWARQAHLRSRLAGAVNPFWRDEEGLRQRRRGGPSRR